MLYLSAVLQIDDTSQVKRGKGILLSSLNQLKEKGKFH